jgi:cytidylate kinase
MGSVVFPDAQLKIYLTASVEARAMRRCKQLSDKGFPANIAALLRDLRERDARDSQRAAAPLKPAEDALQLDSSNLGVDEVVDQIVRWQRER